MPLLIQREEVWIEAGPNAVVSGMVEKILPTIQTLLVGYSPAEMNVYRTFPGPKSDRENSKCLPLQKS